MSVTSLPTPRVAKEPTGSNVYRALRVIVTVGAAIVILGLLAAAGAAWVAPRSQPARLTHTIGRGELIVTVIEQGLLESEENVEIKSKVRGRNTVLWVIDSGAKVKPGDLLVRLDKSLIQEQIDERTKYAHWSRSAAERSEADVTRAKLAVSEYQQGRFIAERMKLEKDLAVAEASLKSARNLLAFTQRLIASNYAREIDLEERQFAVEQAELEVEVKKTQLLVLNEYTKAEQVQTLEGNLKSTTARHEANAERATADASRRDRALAEIENCDILAERAGVVIHPNAAKWEAGPIEAGSSVHKDQILLLMPNLEKMQVKVGVHESVVDRMKEGLKAKVRLPDAMLEGVVSSVASVTRPSGWWTGNQVRYDTMVRLPNVAGLRPGMSAEVEIIVAEYEDVLQIPVAAIVDSSVGPVCFVETEVGVEQRPLVLGDSNDVHTIVKGGVKEGEQVILNPLGLKQGRQAAASAKNSTAGSRSEDTSKTEAKQPTGKQPTGKQEAGKQEAGKDPAQNQPATKKATNKKPTKKRPATKPPAGREARKGSSNS